MRTRPGSLPARGNRRPIEQANALVAELPDLVPVSEAARFLHAHPRTIKAWVSQGRLRAIRAVPHGTSRVLVLRDSIRDMLARSLEAAE